MRKKVLQVVCMVMAMMCLLVSSVFAEPTEAGTDAEVVSEEAVLRGAVEKTVEKSFNHSFTGGASLGVLVKGVYTTVEPKEAWISQILCFELYSSFGMDVDYSYSGNTGVVIVTYGGRTYTYKYVISKNGTITETTV